MAVLQGTETALLSCACMNMHPGGKQLVLHGGQSRSHDSVSHETAVLSLDTLM